MFDIVMTLQLVHAGKATGKYNLSCDLEALLKFSERITVKQSSEFMRVQLSFIISYDQILYRILSKGFAILLA